MSIKLKSSIGYIKYRILQDDAEIINLRILCDIE